MKCNRLGLVLSHLSPPYFDSVLQVWHGRVEHDEANSILCKLLSREWWVEWQVKQWASSVGDLDQVQGECQLRFWANALPDQKVSSTLLVPFIAFAGQQRWSWLRTLQKLTVVVFDRPVQCLIINKSEASSVLCKPTGAQLWPSACTHSLYKDTNNSRPLVMGILWKIRELPLLYVVQTGDSDQNEGRNVSTIIWTFCHAVVIYMSEYMCQKKDRTQW